MTKNDRHTSHVDGASPPKRRPIIRQNPPVNKDVSTGLQYCAVHGAYPTPLEVAQLRQQATGTPDVPPTRARSLLERSERIRRHCPQCGGQAATSMFPLRRAP